MRLILLSFSEPSVYSQRNKCLMSDFDHQPLDYSWDVFMGAKETSPSLQIIKMQTKTRVIHYYILIDCCCCCVSVSVRPYRQQPTRLPRPWDSPGKNTGVGCHFLLQCMKVKSESEVAQSCLTLRDPMDCSLPGSSAHGIFQARVLERVAIAFSCGAS